MNIIYSPTGELAIVLIVAVSRENCLHNTDRLKEQSSQA